MITTDTERLSPPAKWLASSDLGCRTSFGGTETSCPGPLVRVSDPLEHDVVSEHASSFNFKNEDDEVDIAILVYGLAYLAENLDIVRWVLCWAAGEEDGDAYYKYIKKRLQARWPLRTNFRFVDEPSSESHEETWAYVYIRQVYLAGGTIYVNRSTRFWSDAREIWAEGGTSMQTCMFIDVAMALFHEMLHLAGFDHAVEEYSGTCDFAVIAGNSLRWALHERYPVACDSACCSCDQEMEDEPDVRSDWGYDYTLGFSWSEYCKGGAG